MPIVGYSEPDQDGGRLFKTDDGAELYFYGPEAEALAAEVGRQPDLRTAQAGPAVDFGGVRDFENQWAGAAPQPAPVQQRRDVPMMQKRSEVPVPPSMPQMPGTAVPPAAPAAPAAPEMVTLPGSAGVNPQRMIERGVMVPTGETVSEATPINPELREVRGENSINEQMLRRDIADTQARKAYAQELQAAAMLPELEMRAAEAEHQKRQLEQLYERERADIGVMLEEHRSRKVDPNRYWTNKGGFGGAMNGLAVVLGALASGISSIHGQPMPNVALEQVNREIERDIALQQDEIDREGVNARNALALLQHRFGDMQQAKDALRLAMLDVADMQAKEVMSEFGSKEAMQAYQLWQIEHMKAREETERSIETASKGKHSTQFKFTQPVAGSAARQVPVDQLPLAQQVKYYKGQAEISKAKGTIAGGGVDPDVAAKAAGKREEGRVESTKELGKSLSETESAQHAYDALLSAAGLRFNKDTGKVEGQTDPTTGEARDLPGVGLADSRVPRLLSGAKAKDVRQKLENAIDLLARARTGAAIQPFERENFLNMVLGAGTEAEFVNGVEMLQRQINDVRDMHRARYGQPVNQQLEQNRADVERARSQGANAAKLRPY